LQEGKRESQWTLAVKGWEATRKQLSHCSRLGKSQEFVSVAVLQHEDSGNTRFFGSSKTRLSVPGRSMHPDIIRLLAQNNAVIAQNARSSKRAPEAGCRALSSTRVAEKKMTACAVIDQATTMDLDSSVPGQPVGDQQLVQWIFERIDGPPIAEIFPVQ
jgi:hypothetical protein